MKAKARVSEVCAFVGHTALVSSADRTLCNMQGPCRCNAAQEEEQLGGLPADPLHLKVQYWRSTDGWAEGVITDYQPALKKIRCVDVASFCAVAKTILHPGLNWLAFCKLTISVCTPLVPYRVNVLQTKKVEWLDYTPSPCLIVHPNARVTDMTQYM